MSTASLKHRKLIKLIISQRILLLFLLPGAIALIIFNYIPMIGILMAFENYKPQKGFFGSEFIGLQNFIMFFKDADFYTALKNTLGISFFSLLIGFPAPILLALMLDNVNNVHFKKITQTITYLPHFISWVIIASLVYRILDGDTGTINMIIKAFGKEPVEFMRNPDCYWAILITTNVIKEIGWGSIIYLAAISGIDPEQYNAALVDGANRLQRLIHITLPGITMTILLMFILSIGSLVTVNFDAAFNLKNAVVMSSAEVIDTYVFRTGVSMGNFSYATAIGFAQSMISFILVFTALKLSKKFGDYSII